MIGESSEITKVYLNNEKLFKTEFINSKIKIIPSNDDLTLLNAKYLFGYYDEGQFYAITNKLYQYGFYDKGQFKSFDSNFMNEKNANKSIFGYLYKGIFYVYETPPEYIYPKKYQFGYINNKYFISLQQFQNNQYDLSQNIPGRKYPKSKISVLINKNEQTIDPIKYIM
uniref:Astacin domain-containing protein n=1 Tax=Strongyloides stercoralis TaxID=6248 RepID=A0A0K0ECG4_STRER